MAENSDVVPLRLPPSLKATIEVVAAREGISINEFLVAAVVDKVSAGYTEDFFALQRGKGDIEAAIGFLRRKVGEPPCKGDELPEEYRDHPQSTR